MIVNIDGYIDPLTLMISLTTNTDLDPGPLTSPLFTMYSVKVMGPSLRHSTLPEIPRGVHGYNKTTVCTGPGWSQLIGFLVTTQ